tara:strand:+ start:1322 stop:1858 length:537 start_codon:yes stop_codon:yes gene_type:complete
MNQFDFNAVRWGLVLSMLTLLMGVYLGLHFGKDEDDIKKYLKEKATASAVFKGDEKEIAAGAKNGWKYLKRSHEHFQGLGAISVGLILLLSATWLKPVIKTLVSIGIGLGAFVYPLFWYITAYNAADMGKHAAKESLALMAQFGAGIYALSFLVTFGAVLSYAIWRENLPGFLNSFKE